MTAPPEATLADKLVHTLRTQKDQGHYPLTLRRLGELADPQADEAALLDAAAQEPFASAAIVAQKDVNAPVALRDDLATLAASPRLLEFVLEQVCTPESPTWAIDKAAKKLPPDLQAAFVESAGRLAQENRLPETVGVQSGKKGVQFFLKRMPPPPPPRKPEEELVDRLLATLESQGRPGAAEFPLTVRRLVELAGGGADEGVVKKALAAAAFTDRVVLAAKKNPASPVALRQDVEALAASPKLLEFALEQVCSEDKPTTSLDRAAGKLDLDLRGAFTETAARQLDEQRLPESVGTQQIKGSPVLFLKKWPPKAPPPPADVALSQKLVAALEEQRRQGTEYPTTLTQLARRAGADPEADASRLKKALTKEPFAGRVIVAIKNFADSPVALAEDAERLAASPLLLERLLAAARTGDSHAQLAADLVKRLPAALQGPFEAALRGPLPETVGAVFHKGKRLLFLKADIHRPAEPRPERPVQEEAAAEPEPMEEERPAMAGVFEEPPQQAEMPENP